MKEFCYTGMAWMEIFKSFVAFIADNDIPSNAVIKCTYMSGDEESGSEEVTPEHFATHIALQAMVQERWKVKRKQQIHDEINIF